jgi:hypothetical protein
MVAKEKKDDMRLQVMQRPISAPVALPKKDALDYDSIMSE